MLATMRDILSQPSMGACYRLFNEDWSLWSPSTLERYGSIKARGPHFPRASPQVVQTRKHSGEVGIAGAEDSLQILFNPCPGRGKSGAGAQRAEWTLFSQGLAPRCCPQSILARGALCRGMVSYRSILHKASETLQLMSSCFSLKVLVGLYF